MKSSMYILMTGIFLFLFVTISSSSVYAEGEWTEWIVDNFNGKITKPVTNFSVSIAELQVREQSGYGLINLRIRYEKTPGRLIWTKWATHNMRGTRKVVKIPRGGEVVGIQVREQSGYGLVDARLYYKAGQRFGWTSWVTKNQRGRVAQQMCQDGSYGKSMRVKEQSGYGIVNLQMYCEWPN